MVALTGVEPVSTTGPSACNHKRVVRRGPGDSAPLRNGPHSVPTFPLASDIRFAGALDEVTDSFDRRLGWSLVGGNRGIVLGALHRSKTLWFWKECWKPSE